MQQFFIVIHYAIVGYLLLITLRILSSWVSISNSGPIFNFFHILNKRKRFLLVFKLVGYKFQKSLPNILLQSFPKSSSLPESI